MFHTEKRSQKNNEKTFSLNLHTHFDNVFYYFIHFNVALCW